MRERPAGDDRFAPDAQLFIPKWLNGMCVSRRPVASAHAGGAGTKSSIENLAHGPAIYVAESSIGPSEVVCPAQPRRQHRMRLMNFVASFRVTDLVEMDVPHRVPADLMPTSNELLDIAPVEKVDGRPAKPLATKAGNRLGLSFA